MSATYVQRLIKCNSLWNYLKVQHIEILTQSAPIQQNEKTTLFSFERESDADACWTVSSNDFDERTNELRNCKLEFQAAEKALSFKGIIKPTEVREETQTKFGYCNLKSKIISFGPFSRIFPIFNLDLFGNFEVVYFGGSENEAKTCLFNIFTKPSLISLPALYQVPFEVRPGWNRLVVPFSGLKYLCEDWHDMEKIFDPAKVSMFGFNFVATEEEVKFDFGLHSLCTSPLLDQFGRHDTREVWECEEKEAFQVRLSSPITEAEELPEQQEEQQKKRAFSNELR